MARSAIAKSRDLAVARDVLRPRYFKLVGGEPLLHPRLPELLDVARASGIAEVYSVTTNGVLLRVRRHMPAFH